MAIYIFLIFIIFLLNLFVAWMTFNSIGRQLSQEVRTAIFLLAIGFEFVVTIVVIQIPTPGGPYDFTGIARAAMSCVIWTIVLFPLVTTVINTKASENRFTIRGISLVIILLVVYSTMIGPRHQPAMSFFGKVVDQYGKPIEGVNVKVQGLRSGRYFGDYVSPFVTNEDGMFHLEGYTSFLIIVSLEKKGYFIRVKSTQYREFLAGQREEYQIVFTDFLMVGEHPWAGSIQDELKAESYPIDKPLVISAWEISQHPKYVSMVLEKTPWPPIVNTRASFSLEPDARQYTLDLAERYGQKYEGETEGQLYVKFYLAPVMEEGSSFSSPRQWWVQFSAVDGGIVEATKDAYLAEAPESGYKSSVKVRMSMPNYDLPRTRIKTSFYYKANNGKEYGAFTVTIHPLRNEKPYISIVHKMNVSGSRNLYDPDWYE